MINVNLNSFFGYKYLANSQITYSKLNNYSESEQSIIKSTSPFVTQLIMPKDEFKRILNKFSEQNILGSNPKLIIINKNDFRTKKHKINTELYCISYVNRSFIIYKDILYCK